MRAIATHPGQRATTVGRHDRWGGLSATWRTPARSSPFESACGAASRPSLADECASVEKHASRRKRTRQPGSGLDAAPHAHSNGLDLAGVLRVADSPPQPVVQLRRLLRVGPGVSRWRRALCRREVALLQCAIDDFAACRVATELLERTDDQRHQRTGLREIGFHAGRWFQGLMRRRRFSRIPPRSTAGSRAVVPGSSGRVGCVRVPDEVPSDPKSAGIEVGAAPVKRKKAKRSNTEVAA